MDDILHIGVTGTRNGATGSQLATVRRLFEQVTFWTGSRVKLRHGKCKGFDEQVFWIARDLGFLIHAYPSNLNRWVADVESDEEEVPMPPLDRNRLIVAKSQFLIGAPDSYAERRRSGTWSTINYARLVGCPTVLVFPDGEYRVEKD